MADVLTGMAAAWKAAFQSTGSSQAANQAVGLGSLGMVSLPESTNAQWTAEYGNSTVSFDTAASQILGGGRVVEVGSNPGVVPLGGYGQQGAVVSVQGPAGAQAGTVATVNRNVVTSNPNPGTITVPVSSPPLSSGYRPLQAAVPKGPEGITVPAITPQMGNIIAFGVIVMVVAKIFGR